MTFSGAYRTFQKPVPEPHHR